MPCSAVAFVASRLGVRMGGWRHAWTRVPPGESECPEVHVRQLVLLEDMSEFRHLVTASS